MSKRNLIPLKNWQVSKWVKVGKVGQINSAWVNSEGDSPYAEPTRNEVLLVLSQQRMMFPHPWRRSYVNKTRVRLGFHLFLKVHVLVHFRTSVKDLWTCAITTNIKLWCQIVSSLLIFLLKRWNVTIFPTVLIGIIFINLETFWLTKFFNVKLKPGTTYIWQTSMI